MGEGVKQFHETDTEASATQHTASKNAVLYT